MSALATSRTTRALTVEEIQALPASVDIPTAARALNIGRSQAYGLAAAGEDLAPGVPVLKVGRKLRVTKASICEVLLIPATP